MKYVLLLMGFLTFVSSILIYQYWHWGVLGCITIGLIGLSIMNSGFELYQKEKQDANHG